MNSVTANRGYSLLELMIAVAIIATLASIAIPAYNNYIATSRLVEGQNNLAAIAIAQEEYFLENNTYFQGVDIAALETNSLGLWKVAEQDPAAQNFTYQVVAGTTGNIATSYKAIATGNGKAVPVATVLDRGN